MSLDKEDHRKASQSNAARKPRKGTVYRRGTGAKSKVDNNTMADSSSSRCFTLSEPLDVPSSNVYVDAHNDVVWSDYPDFVYWAVYMDQRTVRNALRDIVKKRDITANSMLDIGCTGGAFSVRYLLMLYYKKHLTPRLEKTIADGDYTPHQRLLDAWRSKNSFRDAHVGTFARKFTQPAETVTTTSTTAAQESTDDGTVLRRRRRVQHVHTEQTMRTDRSKMRRLCAPPLATDGRGSPSDTPVRRSLRRAARLRVASLLDSVSD